MICLLFLFWAKITVRLFYKILFLSTITTVLNSSVAFTQDVVSSEAKAARIKLKGIYIYQFARRVYWPEKYTKGDFYIGIYGSKEIFDQLSVSYTGKLVGSQAIKFKFFEKPSEVKNCHLLYVIDENKTLISTINNSIAKQTVMVSEVNDLVSSGSMFNFIYVKGSLKYQINKAKAEQNGFKIDQTLTKLAYNPS